MAKYPIKMLKDENNTPFVPLVGTDAIVDPSGTTLQEKLNVKLEKDNFIAGDNVTITEEDGNLTISTSGKGTLIDNLDTDESGLGGLDAHQGKVLKEMIPAIANNLTTIDATQTLSAYQGYILNNRVVPKGGDEGQVLKKSADGDWQLEWGDAADPNAIIGDGTIKKIVYLTWDEYKALEEIDEYTEYHITDMSENMTYLNRDDIQDMIDNTASNYLLKTGGTLTGDITVKQGYTDEPIVRVDNGTYQLDLLIGASGTNRGLYDRKTSKYLIVADANDTVTVNGHSTSDLSLTGGTMTGGIINTGVVFAHQGYSGDKNNFNQLHWYSVGYSPAASASSPWWTNYALCLNNYWGIDIRTQNDNCLRHNGNIVLTTGNYGVVLWTNSSPTTTFGPQSITATGLSNYSYIEIYFYNWIADNGAGRLIKCMKMPVSNGAKGDLDAAINLYDSSVTTTCHLGQRSATLNTSNNTVTFSVMHGMAFLTSGGNTSLIDNDWLVPIRIVGYR